MKSCVRNAREEGRGFEHFCFASDKIELGGLKVKLTSFEVATCKVGDC